MWCKHICTILSTAYCKQQLFCFNPEGVLCTPASSDYYRYNMAAPRLIAWANYVTL